MQPAAQAGASTPDAIAENLKEVFTPEELAAMRRKVQLCECSFVMGPVVIERKQTEEQS